MRSVQKSSIHLDQLVILNFYTTSFLLLHMQNCDHQKPSTQSGTSSLINMINALENRNSPLKMLLFEFVTLVTSNGSLLF